MTNYSVYEGDGKTVHDELRDNTAIEIGDTIDYVTNNQLGYEKYEVICKEKGLKLIGNIDGPIEGGKRHKRKTNKRRANKKRRTNKKRK